MIDIKRKAYNKMYAYCKSSKQGELGGLILGKVEINGDITVENVNLLDQIRTGSTFEISEDTLMDFTKNSSAKTLTRILGWWHSHVSFGCFWSNVDSACFDRLRGLSNFCLGIVVSIPKKSKEDEMDVVCRLDLTDYNKRKITMNAVEYMVEEAPFKFSYNFGKIKEEIKTKVKEDGRTWKSCPYCRGSGFVENVGKKIKPSIFHPYIGYGMYGEDVAIEEEQKIRKENWRDFYNGY